MCLSLESYKGYFKSFSMRKIIVFCLVVLLASCKDKEVVDADPDLSTDFIGNYFTATANDTYNTNEDWAITRMDKNLLQITYKVVTNYSKPQPLTLTYVYTLKNVVINNATTFTVNESADVDKNGTMARSKVEGTGVKLDVNGLTKIGITFKITDLADNKVTTREYLEFKKK